MRSFRGYAREEGRLTLWHGIGHQRSSITLRRRSGTKFFVGIRKAEIFDECRIGEHRQHGELARCRGNDPPRDHCDNEIAPTRRCSSVDQALEAEP
jgi:hypothetical protein